MDRESEPIYEHHSNVPSPSYSNTHAGAAQEETDIITGSLQEAVSGSHYNGSKDMASQKERNPRSRISQAEAQRRELVMCRIGKQVDSAEEKEKESSKVLQGMKRN